DTGCGIDPDFLPHVFDRFRQANASPTREHGGLGLGLAISRHLVELHGGTIHAHSDGRGRGAELTVKLPCPREDACATGHGCPPPASCPLEGVSVMMVDDDPDVRDVVRQVLEAQGASVRVAASAAEAIDLIRAQKPCIVVSDIGMAGMNGYELVRELERRRAEGAPALPAIALTAYARPEDRERALEVGFLDHLQKPVDAAALVAAVEVASRSHPGRARPELTR